MRTIGIHHVALNVSDVDAALAFYVGTLGLKVRPDRPDFGIAGAWLDLGEQQVHLVKADTPANCGQHFAVAVDDLEAVVEELRARGVEVSDTMPVGKSRQAFTTDPSGNMVELHQPAGV